MICHALAVFFGEPIFGVIRHLLLGEPWGDGGAVAIIAVDFGFNLFAGGGIIHGIAIYTYSGSKNHGDPCTLVLQEKGDILEIVPWYDAIRGHPHTVCLIPLLACAIVAGIDIIFYRSF